ncbi:beta-1,3-galactosyltransferase 5-like isoform X1 [Haliotis rufescens]|uniref:beta-1,3-galactosyltransferase 5-like isoform X1 n=2 Tax=Haliotis rufescens TaxID=6454 RepID=UPI00201EB262|nr:beta-1,3-galactosyltransferase 5-like isoform X1 [Haliotis rufescens]
MGFVEERHRPPCTETQKVPGMFVRLPGRIIRSCFLVLTVVSAIAFLVAFKYPITDIHLAGVYINGTKLRTENVSRPVSSVKMAQPDQKGNPSDKNPITSPKPQPQLKVKTWNRPDENPTFFKRREHKVTPLDFKFTISSDICADGQTDLIIIVLSMTPHRDFRDAIRETWGNAHNNTWAGTTLSQVVRLVFLFGTTENVSKHEDLLKEASKKRDIVQANFTESYFNLTYKVLSGFQWVKDHCPSAKFVMKNDEDSFVHIPWLLERLRSTAWNSKIIGPYFTNQLRYTAGKLAVSDHAYPFHVYPPHVKGNVYVMPTNTAMQILEAAEYMPYMNMEDVHITGILAKVVGAGHKAIPRSEYNPMRRPNVCEFAQRKKFAGRDVSAKYARDIWVKLENPKLCR